MEAEEWGKPSVELKREIELLHLNIRNLKKTFEADKLQIASKKKRLEELHKVFDDLQCQKRNLVIRRFSSSKDSLKKGKRSSLSCALDLPGVSFHEENLDGLREAIQLIREENQSLATQVVNNDTMVRNGPNAGTLALRVKRTIDGRKYADLQRREAEARSEVNILSFHLRNEQSRLHQARLMSNVVVKQEMKQKNEDNYSRAQLIASLNDRLRKSRGRVGALVRQRNEAVKEEEQLNAKIKKLQDSIKSQER